MKQDYSIPLIASRNYQRLIETSYQFEKTRASSFFQEVGLTNNLIARKHDGSLLQDPEAAKLYIYLWSWIIQIL